jgi:rRNA biogenesis protein RRP5
LTVTGGFDWNGEAEMGETPDAESSSDEDEPETTSRHKGKQKATDLTATAPAAQPSSVSEFERALLSSPNSSFLWIQYMSFLLTLHEVDKARSIGRKAVEKIAYREEEEKLNVWMALVNLEIGFGTEETREKVFKEASQYNDARTVYMRYADALQAAGKEDVSTHTNHCKQS